MINKIFVPAGKEWAEFDAREGNDPLHTDRIVVDEIFMQNVYQIKEGMFDDTGVVLDIGANIGAFTIFVLKMGAKKVIAYEPDSENYKMLLRNIQLNGFQDKVVVVKKGIGLEGKTETLYHAQGGSFVKNDSLTGIANEVLENPRDGSEEIEIVNFASVFADNELAYADVLKVDIEGSEYDLFEGVTAAVVKKSRYLCIEFNNTNQERFGRLVAKLSRTHNIHIIGSYQTGGMIYGQRYE